MAARGAGAAAGGADLRRRGFVTLVGSKTVAFTGWPRAPRAQQMAMPVIGFLDSRSPDTMGDRLRGFRQGLNEAGYLEGNNVTVLYRWAENKIDRLPQLAADLVREQVAAIVTGGNAASVFAAKAATELLCCTCSRPLIMAQTGGKHIRRYVSSWSELT